MILYVHRGKNHKGKEGEALVKLALEDYSQSKYRTVEIRRGEKGKPFFEDIAVHFSISHSGELWVCLMADVQVGVDIQIGKKMNHMGVARRFFSGEEADCVEKNGERRFFELWTMKEAYVKYTGMGFSEAGFAQPSLVNQGDMVTNIMEGNKKAYLKNISTYLKDKEIEAGKTVYGFMCSERAEEQLLCREI